MMEHSRRRIFVLPRLDLVYFQIGSNSLNLANPISAGVAWETTNGLATADAINIQLIMSSLSSQRYLEHVLSASSANGSRAPRCSTRSLRCVGCPIGCGGSPRSRGR